MNPLQATWICLSKSFQFSGRAPQDEFWGFFAVLLVFRVIVGPALDLVIFGQNVLTQPGYATITDTVMLLVAPAFATALARRLQDQGISGVWAGVSFLAMLALTSLGRVYGLFDHRAYAVATLAFTLVSLGALVMAFRRSDPQPNRYGPPSA
jgi:uncharacterized membrane protein YhaH (DUF805 family)